MAIEQLLGIPRTLLTTSCTDALEMAALLLGTRPDTLNMDESRLQEALTPPTRALVPVHDAGVACEMDAIRETASTRRGSRDGLRAVLGS